MGGEQDLSAAAKEVAKLPGDLAGLVDDAGVLGMGNDFAEQTKKARKTLDTCVATLKGIAVKISRSRAPARTFQSLVDVSKGRDIDAWHKAKTICLRIIQIYFIVRCHVKNDYCIDLILFLTTSLYCQISF